MSFRVLWIVPFVSLWITVLAPPPAAGQNPADLTAMQIGESLGSAVQQAASGAQQMRASAAQASAEIEAARRRYWQAYRSGRNVEAARAEFAHQLAGKDLYYLLMAVPEGAEGPRARLGEIISGGVDGGIRPAAREEFVAWVDAIRRDLGVGTTRHTMDEMVLPGPVRLAEAAAAAAEHEAAYLRARDWAELDASGVTFPWDTDARAYVLMLLQRYGPVRPAEEVARNYRELLELFGEAEVVAAAERVRAARRDAAGHLVNPSALGVASTQPDLAFTEILAARSGQSYFKYLIWRGDLGIPGHTPAEAAREYERFEWAYGAAAIEAAADSVLNLPKNQYGRIDVRGAENPRLPSYTQVAIWSLLRQGDPDGRIRAIFAFHSEARSRADVDRLRQELERRHGAEAVAEAARALYAFWYLEDGDGPNQARRNEYRREAREAAGLPRNSGAHLYEWNHRLLTRVLERGAVAVLGEHVPARSEEQRLADRMAEELEALPEEWQRRSYMIDRQLHEFWEALDDPARGRWVASIRARYDRAVRVLLDPQYESSRQYAPAINSSLVGLLQVLGTVQTHCDLSDDPEGELCRIARLVEESAEEMYAAVLERWPHAEVSPPPYRRGVPDPERALSDVAGAWAGTFRDNRAGIFPLTVRIAVPGAADEPIGTMEFTRRAGGGRRASRGDLYYLGNGFIGIGFSGGLGSYSLHYRPTEGGGNPLLVTVQPTETGQVDVQWYALPGQAGRPGDTRHRRIASGRLDPRPVTADLPPQRMEGCPDGLVYEWIDRMPVRSHLTGGTVRNDTLVVVDRRARRGTATVRFVVAPPPRGGARNIQVSGPDRRVNEAAVELIEKSRFSRGTHQGRPACVWMELPVTFRRQR